MRVSDMIFEVYSQLGKPSDLDPMDDLGENVDIDSMGARRILSWLNRGYKRILMWRFPNGRIVRFKRTEKSLYFQTVVLEGFVAASTIQTTTLDAAAGATLGRYVGWTLEIAGERRKVMAYTAARVATVNKEWGVAPAIGATWRLYKNFYTYVPEGHITAGENIVVNPVEDIMAVVRVTDMASGSVLQRADRTSNFEGALVSRGVPGLFQDREDGLFFDMAIDEERYYELRYVGFPPNMVGVNDEPAVPPQFHEAILLWTVWWGLRRYQEFNGAYSTKRDLEDLMSSALQQMDLVNDREEISLYMEGNYGSY